MRHDNIKLALALCLSGLLLGFGLVQAQEQKQEQEQRVQLKDLPAAVQKTAREQSKGAKILGYSKEIEEDKTYYEVEMMVKGRGKDVLIDESGIVVEVEEQVTLASLPPAVKSEIVKQAGKGKILKVESVTKSDKLVFYEAHVKTAGKISEIKVDPDGKPIGQ
jgi:uncharacterized membrane protein YkoI